MKLTQNETEIMEVLWRQARPLTGKEIKELSPENKTWKDSSIHILLNSLLKKGAIKESGFVRTGKGFGRTFEPTQSGKTYYANLLADMIDKTDVSLLFSNLFEQNKITDDTILELEEMLMKEKEK